MLGPDDVGDGVGDLVGLIRRGDFVGDRVPPPRGVAGGLGLAGELGLQGQGLAQRPGDPLIGAAQPIDLVRVGGRQRLGMDVPHQRQVQSGPLGQ